MTVVVACVRGVQVAYVTLHHRGCTLVPPSTWGKRVPRMWTRIESRSYQGIEVRPPSTTLSILPHLGFLDGRLASRRHVDGLIR